MKSFAQVLCSLIATRQRLGICSPNPSVLGRGAMMGVCIAMRLNYFIISYNTVNRCFGELACRPCNILGKSFEVASFSLVHFAHHWPLPDGSESVGADMRFYCVEPCWRWIAQEPSPHRRGLPAGFERVGYKKAAHEPKGYRSIEGKS